MPSSLIFAGLVVIWLLILVPAVARRQQEVARLSPAALSGRVLERPIQRRRTQEVGQVEQAEDPRPVATQPERAEQTRTAGRTTDARVPADEDERHWERPPARYRPGRGGFDPEAAALAARARYAIRQRIVLSLLALAGITALVAGIAMPTLWWLHALIDLALVGYLVYLRRQVRMEETIRARRAARMAGTRRPPAADDPELDEWADRGREAGRPQVVAEAPDAAADEAEPEAEDPAGEQAADEAEEHGGNWADDADDDPARVRGTGEPLGVLPARCRTVKTGGDGEDDDLDEAAEPDSALPRLQPAPPPPLPAGTTLVEVDEEDAELSELDAPVRPDYRRAAGQ
ncbi:hypothetical protein [Pseudonocardia acidicola]|uniref:Uncharacterized protein n=1 Tax=Pseudonocardia acidicola TaxID=2724939 RepID=A0ABX1SC74_9PSEU|nr:hypothetical protein [Pseudonocardia acidicola]NMH98477.1 hypothetical protein [Pseudonocardia acidicola]